MRSLFLHVNLAVDETNLKDGLPRQTVFRYRLGVDRFGLIVRVQEG